MSKQQKRQQLVDDLMVNIPDHVFAFIASAGSWADGDTWVIGNGLVVEYDKDTRQFVLHNRKSRVVLGRIHFNEMMDKAKKVKVQT